MRCNQPTALSLLITILAFPVVSQAAPVTVTATGVVYNVNDPDNRLPFTPLIVGSTRVAITFTYESNAFGFDLNSTTKLYPLAITAMSLTIGDTTLTPTVNEGPIAILDDTDISENRPDLPYMDQWNSSADAVGVDETERFKFILLTLSSTTPVGPLTSTDLVEPVWPSAWNQGHIRYQIVDTNNYEIVLASVSAAIIPIPPALWLLGSALGLLGWMRRKTSGVFGRRGISLSFCAER